MAEVHIVDIDGEQWDIKDLPLTGRVTKLEEIGTVINDEQTLNISQQGEYFYGNYISIPKGTWLVMLHADAVREFSGYALLGADTDGSKYPSREAIIMNGYSGGFGQVNCVIVSNGTSRVRAMFYAYSDSNFSITLKQSLVKLAN